MNYTIVTAENKKMDLKVKDKEHDTKFMKRLKRYLKMSGGKSWPKQRD